LRRISHHKQLFFHNKPQPLDPLIFWFGNSILDDHFIKSIPKYLNSFMGNHQCPLNPINLNLPFHKIIEHNLHILFSKSLALSSTTWNCRKRDWYPPLLIINFLIQAINLVMEIHGLFLYYQWNMVMIRTKNYLFNL